MFNSRWVEYPNFNNPCSRPWCTLKSETMFKSMMIAIVPNLETPGTESVSRLAFQNSIGVNSSNWIHRYWMRNHHERWVRCRSIGHNQKLHAVLIIIRQHTHKSQEIQRTQVPSSHVERNYISQPVPRKTKVDTLYMPRRSSWKNSMLRLMPYWHLDLEEQ